jgi:hypothetical protein
MFACEGGYPVQTKNPVCGIGCGRVKTVWFSRNLVARVGLSSLLFTNHLLTPLDFAI